MPLNEYRYYCSKQIKSLSLNLLPQTNGALKKNIDRVYLQCQTWLRNNIDPCSCGWRKNAVENILEPEFSEDKLISGEILKKFKYPCKSNCTNKCGCRKIGLKCNNYCNHCKGIVLPQREDRRFFHPTFRLPKQKSWKLKQNYKFQCHIANSAPKSDRLMRVLMKTPIMTLLTMTHLQKG